MILLQSVLVILVGLDVLDYRDYDWFLPGFLIQSLAQVIGLAVYAVKHLFSDINNQVSSTTSSPLTPDT